MTVNININKDGTAEVTAGKNSLVGKILTSGRKIKIKSPLINKEVTIK